MSQSLYRSSGVSDRVGDNVSNSSLLMASKSDIMEVDRVHHNHKVTWKVITVILGSLILHFIDVVFDMYVPYNYYLEGQLAGCWWNIGFVALATIIVTAISVKMYVDDYNEGVLTKAEMQPRIVLCVLGMGFQTAPAIRYYDSLVHAFKSRKAKLEGDKDNQKIFHDKMLREGSDVALVKVVEGYIESATSQTLQITFLMLNHINGMKTNTLIPSLSIVLSFIAMGCSMASYHRAIRLDQEDKKKISYLGLAFQFLWHLSLTAHRILAMSAAIILYPLWTGLAVVVHWFVMTTWIASSKKTNFCGDNYLLEKCFAGAVGLVYVYNFISLKDEPTRKSYLAFYSILFFENILIVILWNTQAYSVINSWLYYFFLISPTLLFVFSVTCALIYYTYLHPNKFNGTDVGCNK